MRAGQLVREALKERGWSQNELAERVGEESGPLSRILNGKRKASVELVVKIHRLLGVPVEAWVEEDAA